jgi:hypothetical protein
MKFTVQYSRTCTVLVSALPTTNDGDDFLVPGFVCRPCRLLLETSSFEARASNWMLGLLARTERLFLSKELPPLLKSIFSTFSTYEEPRKRRLVSIIIVDIGLGFIY